MSEEPESDLRAAGGAAPGDAPASGARNRTPLVSLEDGPEAMASLEAPETDEILAVLVLDRAGQWPASDTQLARRVRTGLWWSFANQVAVRVVTVGSGIALARLLRPQDFGIFALALTASTILLTINDLGLSWGLVRAQEDEAEVPRLARTAFTIALVSSLLMYAVCFVAAPVVGAAIGSPRAGGVLRLLSVIVLIDAFSAVPAAVLTRRFAQDRRALAEVSGLVVSFALSIFLALHGYGAWSLAWGRVAGNAVTALIANAVAMFWVWPGWSTRDARKLLGFGFPYAGATLLSYTVLNVDYLLVGVLLGPIPLGFYLLAFNLSSWPVNTVTAAVRRVSVAGLAQLAGRPEALERSFIQGMAMVVAGTLPCALGLAVVARPLVSFVYGARWANAAGVLPFLALLGAVRVGAQFTDDLLVALGRSRTALALQAAWLVVLVPVLAVGARIHGISGVGMGHAVVGLLFALPLFLVAIRRVGISLAGLFEALRRPLLASAAGAAATVVGLRLGERRIEHLAGSGLMTVVVTLVVLAGAPRRIAGPQLPGLQLRWPRRHRPAGP